jgi:cardiolipin synthase A/B
MSVPVRSFKLHVAADSGHSDRSPSAPRATWTRGTRKRDPESETGKPLLQEHVPVLLPCTPDSTALRQGKDPERAPQHTEEEAPLSVLLDLWPYLLAGAVPVLQATAAVHVILHKRNVRSAVGWVGLIWLAPVVGVVLYALLGVNRIQRKARALDISHAFYQEWIPSTAVGEAALCAALPPDRGHLAGLVVLGDRVCGRPLLDGNHVVALVDGDEAYPAMLEAIAGANRSVSVASYIFDAGRVGDRFVSALGEAVRRGVEVRVLIDDVGARYSRPRIAHALRRVGVPVAHFMPGGLPWRMPYFNLRNHRKIMVVDGRVGFTGGMNIRDEFWSGGHYPPRARDLHFRLEGPVVPEIQEAFADDWTFTTGERLEGTTWFPAPDAVGRVKARGISDGPDIDYEKLETMMLGALSVAQRSVQVITPYFLPDPALLTALNVAALRGVDVEVIIPAKGNLALVQWASTAQLDQLLEKGVRIFASPRPFDHSKLLVVDRCWTLVGSANWDPRSLQLNFEFNVECYDVPLGEAMGRLFEERKAESRPVTLEGVQARPFPVKVRDGVARLFSPYL